MSSPIEGPHCLGRFHRRSSGNTSKMIAAVLALACAAFTYRAFVNAADWRTSATKARDVIADPKATDAQLRDALYVLYRHEVENAKCFLGAIDAGRGPEVTQHAENLLAQIRDAWK